MIDKYSATWVSISDWALLRLIDARAELENELTDDRRAQWLRGHIAALSSLMSSADERKPEVLPTEEYH